MLGIMLRKKMKKAVDPAVVYYTTIVWALIVSLCSTASIAQELAAEDSRYRINAGDILQVNVWNEPTLSLDQVLVRPDGYISAPVVGEIYVGGQRIADAVAQLKTKLNAYLRDEPTVVITVLKASGSNVYVLGKVNRPGAFSLSGSLDVTQALALAGGTNQFAAENKIKVFRRDASGKQRVFTFKLGEIKNGDNLASNILLQSGDLVLVP